MANFRTIPAFAPELLMKLEAVKLRSYRDSVGIWTAGVGHTGTDVSPYTTYTSEQVKKWLMQDLHKAAKQVCDELTQDALDALTDHEYVALMSFTFNLGCKDDWTIWKTLNAGKLNEVPAQLMRFDRARDRTTGQLVELRGLKVRRSAEVAFWNTADVAAAHATVKAAEAAGVEMPSSSEMRAADTPPAPMPAKPLAAPSIAAKIGSLAAGAGLAAKQVLDLVAPHADTAPIFAQAVTVLTGVVVVAGIAALWINHEQHKQAQL